MKERFTKGRWFCFKALNGQTKIQVEAFNGQCWSSGVGYTLEEALADLQEKAQ